MVIRAVLGVMLGAAVLAVAVSGAWTPGPHTAPSVVPRPVDAQPMVVREVLSGDTVVLVNQRPGAYVQGWGLVTARLLDINAPNFGLINECFAIEAQGRLRQLLPEGSTAWVSTGGIPRDEGGRWFMNVWTSDGVLASYALAVDGFVRAQPTPPGATQFPAIAQATEQAFRLNAGLWGECG